MERLRPGLWALLVLATGSAYCSQIGLISRFGSPRLVVTRQAGVHVLRESVIPLVPGENRLTFDFASVGADPATSRLSVATPAEGVRIVQEIQPPGEPNRSVWVLQADAPAAARLRLAYAVKGLETTTTYRMTLHPADSTLDLDCDLTLRHGGPEPFPDAEVVLPSGRRLTADLGIGETILLNLQRYAQIPYQAYYLCDFSRYQTAVHAVLRVAREGTAELDTCALPAGPLKVYAPGADGLLATITEAALPYVPPHEPLEVDLGPAPEVSMSRTRVRAVQLNERTDVYRRVVLYDLEEQFDLGLANRRGGPTELKVRESIPGQWTMVRESRPSHRLDASTVEYTLTLQAGESAVISYTVKRLNVEP